MFHCGARENRRPSHCNKKGIVLVNVIVASVIAFDKVVNEQGISNIYLGKLFTCHGADCHHLAGLHIAGHKDFISVCKQDSGAYALPSFFCSSMSILTIKYCGKGMSFITVYL